MPVKPENRGRYPANWAQIRDQVRTRANDRCELCGVKNHALGGRVRGVWHDAVPKGEKNLRLEWPKPGEWSHVVGCDERVRIIRIVCTVAHWFDDRPEACDLENLRFACQRCHLNHDRHLHAQNSYESRRKGRAIDDLFGAPTTDQVDALRARSRRNS